MVSTVFVARRKGLDGLCPSFASRKPDCVRLRRELGVRVHPQITNKIKNSITEVILFLMARGKGLEPLTYWFVASHSIQLSYRRSY